MARCWWAAGMVRWRSSRGSRLKRRLLRPNDALAACLVIGAQDGEVGPLVDGQLYRQRGLVARFLADVLRAERFVETAGGRVDVQDADLQGAIAALVRPARH